MMQIKIHFFEVSHGGFPKERNCNQDQWRILVMEIGMQLGQSGSFEAGPTRERLSQGHW